jgi:long-chain fatty acid transport protein
LINYQLDCDQSGWGVNPILGANYHNGPLTLTAKYEFRTKLNIPNSTSVNSDPDGLLSAFKDGNKTRYDIPALLSIAAGYEFTPKLRATLEYHWFDDKHAKMSDNRQEALKRGTNEFLAGVEYDINKTWTVSVGGQRTDYGLSDDYQTNTSFACDSYSIGAGVAVNVNEHVRINAGYFTTLYSDYEKQVDNYYDTKLSGTETLKRTNGVIGFGIDYKF